MLRTGNRIRPRAIYYLSCSSSIPNPCQVRFARSGHTCDGGAGAQGFTSSDGTRNVENVSYGSPAAVNRAKRFDRDYHNNNNTFISLAGRRAKNADYRAPSQQVFRVVRPSSPSQYSRQDAARGRSKIYRSRRAPTVRVKMTGPDVAVATVLV